MATCPICRSPLSGGWCEVCGISAFPAWEEYLQIKRKGNQMNNSMIPFEYEDKKVRVIPDENDNPLFVAKDVCEVLDYADTKVAIRKLDDDEKLTRKIYVSGQDDEKLKGKIYPSGQNREVSVITESGLYTLIIRSNKPQAKPFRRWVTHEVLPSIRKTGEYARGNGKKPGRPRKADDKHRQLSTSHKTFQTYMKIAKSGGLNQRDARIWANEQTFDETGIDIIRLCNPGFFTEEIPAQDQLPPMTTRELMEEILRATLWLRKYPDADPEERTVEKILFGEMKGDGESWIRLLCKAGIKPAEGEICFYPRAIAMHLLSPESDPDPMRIKSALLRIPGSRWKKKFINGSRPYCAAIPRQYFETRP